MRLIDADALWENIRAWRLKLKTEYFITDRVKSDVLNTVLAVIDNQPTIDAEPVVRCKDCKHFKFGDYCYHDGIMEHSHARENDFCSYGERRAAYADEDDEQD